MNQNEDFMVNMDLKDFRKKIKSSDFETSYSKLMISSDLEENEINHLLKCAIIFVNFGDLDIQKLGYKIIVNYSNQYNDYKPLYDFAINKGFIPISKLIESNYFDEGKKESFFSNYLSAFHDNFKESNYYISNGQKKLIEFSKNNNKTDFVLVAPTSYGKSEIIVNKVLLNLNKITCIIVPSKALLTQTKKRLLKDSGITGLNRIITHPEMYKGTEVNFVAVLTQERLLRLLQKNSNLKFDLVLIDEAHNLFGDKEDDERAVLLAQVIIILKKRNSDTRLNFFSPFISNSDNLRIKQSDYSLENQFTEEFIKTEKYFVCNTKNGNNELKIYEQFSDRFLLLRKYYSNEFDLLNEESAAKNIIYLNRPKHIEEFSKLFSEQIQDSLVDSEEIVNTISDFLHPDYNLISCIKKGVVYHHGGMPEIVRLYVESIFSEKKELKFVITSSTLLEGVNIPAEKIFLLSTKKGKRNLSTSQFKNLIGRVNRFSEIFDKENGGLTLLEPNVYIVKGNYSDNRANIENFVRKNAKTEISIEDEVNNLFLKDEQNLSQDQRQKLNNSLEYLENIEPNSTDLVNVDYVNSEIAQACYRNNIYDFGIKISERVLIRNLFDYLESNVNLINNVNDLLEAFYLIFLKNIDIQNKNIERLTNIAARRFYSMILEWRSTGTSYKEMIGSFLSYWGGLDPSQQFIYIGEKWGELKRLETDFIPLYVDLSKKTRQEKVNLAILKIKEEQDYVEFNLLKYIDIMADLELLEKNFYEKIKYGSSDLKIIMLLKNGFSIELAKIVVKSEYSDFIVFDFDKDEIILNENILVKMEANLENKILIFEVKYHINQ